MRWMDFVARDAVPWLLDPTNPSVRYLTLRDIFRRRDESLAEEQQRILTWPPIRSLRRHWDKYNFWGRAENPYFGGPLGNFGTLYLMAQLGAPHFEEADRTCENLLDRGRRQDRRFGPEGSASAPWLAYAGMALHILLHFGYGDDPRTLMTWSEAVQTIHADPQRLDCPIQDTSCRSGAVKLLGAFQRLPPDQRTSADESAIDILCQYLVDHTYAWRDENRDWMIPHFPRYYDADIIEFCHVLSETIYRTHTTCRDALQHMLTLQDAQGRWLKLKSTPALPEERIHQPNRWLTFEAIHSLMQVYGDETYAP